MLVDKEIQTRTRVGKMAAIEIILVQTAKGTIIQVEKDINS